MLHNLMVLFTSWLYSQVPSVSSEQMQAEAEDSHCHSEDDFDEDEATQYIIEQSLIQYRKLKRLSPRSEVYIYIYIIWCKTLLFDLIHTLMSTVISNPTRTRMWFSRPSKKVNWCSLIRFCRLSSTMQNNFNDIQVIMMHWTDWQYSRRPFPEWMNEDGSHCMKLQHKRIKRSLRLSSQVIQIASVTLVFMSF